MKALSFSRPWTELVVTGVKDVENRSWSTSYRGPLVVHAAKSWDVFAAGVLNELMRDGMLSENDYALLDTCAMQRNAPTGYLGVVTVADCHRSDSLACRSDENPDRCSPWAFDGSWHWSVTDARRFPEPIPGGGQLNLWVPPDEVLRAASRCECGKDAPFDGGAEGRCECCSTCTTTATGGTA